MAAEKKLKKELPKEMILEIALRLPPKSIGRFKSVSKPWKFFLSSPNFVKSHLHHQLRRAPERVILIDKTFIEVPHVITLATVGNSRAVQSPAFKDNRSIDLLGCCNGLALINVQERDGYYNFVVINPVTSRAMVVDNPVSHYHALKMSFGLGYNRVDDDYKIVYLINSLYDESVTLVRIYSLKRRGNWEELADSKRRWILKNRPGVNADGRLHWLAYKDDDVNLGISSLDLCTKKFEEVPSPTGFAYEFVGQFKMPRCKLAVMGGCLAILDSKVDGIDVWIRGKSGEEMSWRKFTIATYPDLNDMFEVICRLGEFEFVLAKNYKELVTYDCESRVWRNLDIDGLPKSFWPRDGKILTFRESLMCPPYLFVE